MYLLIDGYLGWFYIFVIVNCVVINNVINMYVKVYFLYSFCSLVDSITTRSHVPHHCCSLLQRNTYKDGI